MPGSDCNFRCCATRHAESRDTQARLQSRPRRLSAPRPATLAACGAMTQTHRASHHLWVHVAMQPLTGDVGDWPMVEQPWWLGACSRDLCPPHHASSDDERVLPCRLSTSPCTVDPQPSTWSELAQAYFTTTSSSSCAIAITFVCIWPHPLDHFLDF